MTTIRRTLLVLRKVVPVLAAACGVGAATASLQAQPAPPEIVESSIAVSSAAATLELELSDGETHRIEFRDGRVRFDGQVLGAYEPGGDLERAWRELLADATRASPSFEMTAGSLRGWEPAAGASDGTAEALSDRLDRALRAEPPARPEDTVSMEGPGGDAVSLAPGRLSFDRLTDRLRELEVSLGRLGAEAREAGEDISLVVHDDYEIAEGRSVDGNLALLGGDLRLGGTVAGDVLVLDGALILEPTGRVEGDVLRVGGDLRREGGTVTGEMLFLRLADGERTAPPAPEAGPDARDLEERIEERVRERVRELRNHGQPGFFGRVTRNVGRAVGGVIGWIGVYLVLGLAGVLAVYFLRPRLEVVADTARHAFGRSFGVGLAGGFLFFPVLLILVVAVITWLVIPFYFVATALALLGGLLAVAHGAGEMVARRRFRYEWMERLRRSNSYYYVLSGLAVLLVPFAAAEALHLLGPWLSPLRGFIVFLASTLLAVVAVTGLGAVLLSRGGDRTDYARPAGAAEAAEPEGSVP